MTVLWDVVVDDRLDRAADTAAFLQSFCPPDADPIWSAEYLRWKLSASNPAGPGYCTVATHGDRVVGSATMARRRMWFDDRVQVGVELGDVYTDPAFRRTGAAALPFDAERAAARKLDPGYLSRSVFGRLVTETRMRAEADDIRLIYGTPNENALPGYCNRLDFFELLTHRTENFLRPTVIGLSIKLPALGRGIRMLAPLDRFAALLRDGIARLSTSGATVAPFDGPDDEIDRLWDSAKRGMTFSLVRDSTWFRYRYGTHPLNRYELLAVRRGGALQALVVTRRFVTMRGRPYLYVADWLFEAAYAQAFGRALAYAVRAAAADDVDGVLLWAENRSLAAGVARANGFLRRGKSSIVFANGSEAEKLARQAPQLDMTIGSSDNV